MRVSLLVVTTSCTGFIGICGKKLGGPLDYLIPSSGAEAYIGYRGKSSVEIGGRLEVANFSNVEGLGLFLLIGDKKALALHHHKAFPADCGVECLLGEKGRKRGAGFLVLF